DVIPHALYREERRQTQLERRIFSPAALPSSALQSTGDEWPAGARNQISESRTCASIGSRPVRTRVQPDIQQSSRPSTGHEGLELEENPARKAPRPGRTRRLLRHGASGLR